MSYYQLPSGAYYARLMINGVRRRHANRHRRRGLRPQRSAPSSSPV
jgi:hypothetical protein